MNLLPFSQQNSIPEQYFDSLIRAQIYCWGREPFGEFKKCINPECQENFSIDDFFDTPSLSDDFLQISLDCLHCGYPTQDVYEWEDFSKTLRDYFALQVSGILLIDEEEVKGFNLFRKTDIDSLFDWEFATREDGFQNPQLKKIITDTLDSYESIICWQHLFIDETMRSEQLFWNMLSRLSFCDIGKDVPVIVETRYESRVYPFLRLLGFQEFCQDRHGYITLLHDSFYKLRTDIGKRKSEFPTNIRELKLFLREAQSKIGNNI